MTPQTKIRVALLLWLVLGFTVWNVIFDRVLVLAGRRYSHDAVLVARSGAYLPIDDVMKTAVRDGVRQATVAGVAIAVFGAGAVWLASRRYRVSTSSKNEVARASLD